MHLWATVNSSTERWGTLQQLLSQRNHPWSKTSHPRDVRHRWPRAPLPLRHIHVLDLTSPQALSLSHSSTVGTSDTQQGNSLGPGKPFMGRTQTRQRKEMSQDLMKQRISGIVLCYIWNVLTVPLYWLPVNSNSYWNYSTIPSWFGVFLRHFFLKSGPVQCLETDLGSKQGKRLYIKKHTLFRNIHTAYIHKIIASN